MKTILAVAIALAAFSVPVEAQSASFTPFGNACAWNAPPLTALTLPRIGTTFVVETLSGGSNGGYEGGTSSALLVGISRTSWQGRPLPLPAGVFQGAGIGAGGELSVSVDAIVAMPFSFRRQLVSTSFPIPTTPSLIGARFFLQAMDYRVNLRGLLGLTFGVAGEARIGT